MDDRLADCCSTASIRWGRDRASGSSIFGCWSRMCGSRGRRSSCAAATRRWPIRWRQERIRTASEIPVEVDLTDEDAIPIYMRISDKVLHLRRLGVPYASIADRLGVNLWMAKRAARWGNIRQA